MPLIKFNENVFMLKTSDYSCNSFLIKAEKNVLIDSGLVSAVPEHIEMLNSINLKPEDIDLVLHTHGHWDHFQADKIYVNAIKFMSEFDAKHLIEENPEITRTKENHFYPKIDGFFEENEVIELNPFKLKVIFTSGHTQGGVCFYEEKQKWLFSGDTLFAETIGRTDLPTGSFDEIKSSIQKLSELEIKYLFSGHGRIVSGLTENKENFKFIFKAFF